MAKLTWIAVSLGACALLGAACGSEVGVNGSTSCVPGESAACTGENGCSGFQVCAADGMSYGSCQCGSGGDAGTGGSGNTGGGGSGATGGTATGSGATGGAAAAGGTGGSEPDPCPPMEPEDEEPCSEPAGTTCSYDGSQCLCFWDEWWCGECPDDLPSPSDPCNGGGPGTLSPCFYGDVQCHCRWDEWVCATCPDEQPQEWSFCSDRGVLCVYDETECACMGGGGGGVWNCSGWY